MCSAKDRYTLIEQSSNSRITCKQHSQKNFMRVMIKRIMGKILERIIGKILSITGAGLFYSRNTDKVFCMERSKRIRVLHFQ